MWGAFQKKQRPRRISPLRPLDRQHAADGLNLFIPQNLFTCKCFACDLKHFSPLSLDLVRAPSPFTTRAYHCLGAIGRGTAIAATGLYAIRDARTNDAHFEQEGFRALLRN